MDIMDKSAKAFFTLYEDYSKVRLKGGAEVTREGEFYEIQNF